MGNQHSESDKGGEDEHSQLMENYNIIKTVQDDRYGEGVLMQNKVNATQCILKEYNSTDEQEFEKTYAKYKKKQDFNHENIVMMIGLAKKKESQLCSTFFKVYVLYEYVTDNLEKTIQFHAQMRKQFTENKLWDLLIQSVSGLAYLQMKGIAHQNIKPSNIFFDQNQRVKIADSQVIQQMNMFSQVATNLKDTPKNSYLSPSLIDALRQNNWQPNHDPNKSDVFSLGMAIMSAGLIQDLDCCYGYQPEPIFFEDVFKQKFNQFKTTFSSKITNLVGMMTQFNEDNRPDFTQLWIQLQQVSNQDVNSLNNHNNEGQYSVMSKDINGRNSFGHEKSKQSPSHQQKDFDDNENIIDDVDDQTDLIKRQNPSNYNKNYAEKQINTQFTKNQIEQNNRNFTPASHQFSQMSADSQKNSFINNTMSQLNPSTVQSGIIGKQTVQAFQDSPAQQNINLKVHNQSPNFTSKVTVNPQNEQFNISTPMNKDLQVTQSKVNPPQSNYSCKTNPDEIQGNAIGQGTSTYNQQVQINNQQNQGIQSQVNTIQNTQVNVQSQNIGNHQRNYSIGNGKITPIISHKNNLSSSNISANLKQNEVISGIQKQNSSSSIHNQFNQQQQFNNKQNLNDISNINNYQNIDDFKISNQSNIFLNNNNNNNKQQQQQQPPINQSYKPYSQNNFENKTKLDDFQNISVTTQVNNNNNNNSFLDNHNVSTQNQKSITNYKEDFNSNQSVSNNIQQNNTSYQISSINKNFGNLSNNNQSNNISSHNIQPYNAQSVNIPSNNMSYNNLTYNNISTNNIQSNNIPAYKPLSDYTITGITSTAQQFNAPYSQNQDKSLLTNFEELQSKLREAEQKAKQEYEAQHGKPVPNTNAVHTFTINQTSTNTSSSPYTQAITKTNDDIDEIMKKYSIQNQNQTNNSYGNTNNQYTSDINIGTNNRRNSQYKPSDISGTTTTQTFSFANQLPNNTVVQNKNGYEGQIKNINEVQDKNPYLDFNNSTSTYQQKSITPIVSANANQSRGQIENTYNNLSQNNDQSYKLQTPQHQQKTSQQYEQYNSQETHQMQYPEQLYQNHDFNQQQFQNNNFNQQQFQNTNTNLQQYQNNNFNQQQFQQHDNFNNQQNNFNYQNNDNQYYSNDFGEAVIENYQNGSRYEGEKLNGVRHGLGRFYYQDGGLYDGEWKDNKMNGRGILSYASGEVAYDGSWKDDQFHGFGALYNENPAELLDYFDYRDFDQVDEYWIKYDGEFKEDNKEGFGTLYLSNGERFEGSFKNDFVCGPGSFYKRNGQKIDGIWQNNKLIQP